MAADSRVETLVCRASHVTIVVLPQQQVCRLLRTCHADQAALALQRVHDAVLVLCAADKSP